MTTETDAVAALAVSAAQRLEAMEAVDGRQLIVLPSGEHLWVDAEDQALLFIARDTVHQTCGSFADHVAAYMTESSVLFLDLKTLSIEAVLDYDTPPAEVDDEAVAGRARHRARLVPVETDEWKTLKAALNEWLDRDQFADLVSELEEQIVDPNQSAIATIAEQINVSTETKFSAGEVRADGSRTFTFVESARADGGGGAQKVTIPAWVTFSVRPHFDSPRYTLKCKFRYRAREGVLSLRLEFVGFARLHRDIFESYRDSIVADDRLGDLRSVNGAPGK